MEIEAGAGFFFNVLNFFNFTFAFSLSALGGGPNLTIIMTIIIYFKTAPITTWCLDAPDEVTFSVY